MRRNLFKFGVVVGISCCLMPNALAGGYSRSADEVTASYMEAIIARVVAKTVFGRAAPAPLTSRCKISVISKIKTPESLAHQMTFKERPERCVPVLATNFAVGSFEIAYPAVIPCDQIQNLLSRVLADPKMKDIRVSSQEYDELGLSILNRNYNFLYGLVDEERFASADYKNMIQSLSRISKFEISNAHAYCKVTVRIDIGDVK